jgi:lactonase family protein with 7-bladed beta-propeller
VKIDPSGKFLYVTNRNSNDVSAFAINSLTGGLTPLAGSPFPTPVTPQAIVIDHKSAFAYIANCSDGITAYSINSVTGVLTSIAGSPFTAGFCPWWITLDPSGQFAFVANAGGSVSAFTVDSASGALAPAPGSPFPAGRFPASIAVDPTGEVVMVSNNTDGNVGSYRINPANGALTLIGTSPAGAQPGSLAITGATINAGPNATTTGGSCGATDVSSQVRVVRSGMNYLPFSTYEYSENITVSNSGLAISGPLYLVLDGLPTSSKGLLGNQLVTHCGTTSPMGSYLIPLVFNLVGGELPQGASTGVPLVFASQDPFGIAYTTRVLSGTPNQ